MNPAAETTDILPLPSTLQILLLCLHDDLGRAFLKTVCPRPAGLEGDLQVEGLPVHLRVLAGEPRGVPGWEETVREADGVVVLLRFLDVVAMDRLRSLYRRLPADRSSPLLMLLFREEGERDFKVSCPACGQKLWIRDEDVGKRGRCPNCTKAFRLPSQAGFLRTQLMLSDAVQILTVISGRVAACRGALANLVGQMNGAIVTAALAVDQDVLKKTTVRVQIQPENG